MAEFEPVLDPEAEPEVPELNPESEPLGAPDPAGDPLGLPDVPDALPVAPDALSEPLDSLDAPDVLPDSAADPLDSPAPPADPELPEPLQAASSSTTANPPRVHDPRSMAENLPTHGALTGGAGAGARLRVRKVSNGTERGSRWRRARGRILSSLAEPVIVLWRCCVLWGSDAVADLAAFGCSSPAAPVYASNPTASDVDAAPPRPESVVDAGSAAEQSPLDEDPQHDGRQTHRAVPGILLPLLTARRKAIQLLVGR
jgi:hypothetical protein